MSIVSLAKRSLSPRDRKAKQPAFVGMEGRQVLGPPLIPERSQHARNAFEDIAIQKGVHREQTRKEIPRNHPSARHRPFALLDFGNDGSDKEIEHLRRFSREIRIRGIGAFRRPRCKHVVPIVDHDVHNGARQVLQRFLGIAHFLRKPQIVDARLFIRWTGAAKAIGESRRFSAHYAPPNLLRAREAHCALPGLPSEGPSSFTIASMGRKPKCS